MYLTDKPSLWDLNGKLVWQNQPLSQMPGDDQDIFGLSGLTLIPGIYLVKMITSEGQAIRKLTLATP